MIVALAGHGLQPTGDPDSYFCPVDAQPQVKATLLSVGGLIRSLDNSGAGAKLLLVDACRNDPDPSRGRGLDGGSVATLPDGVAALFSCSAGQKAYETAKAGGGHGVFFHFVLQGLRGQAVNRRGEVTWDRLSEFVREEVQAGVAEMIDPAITQTPRALSHLGGKSPVLATGLEVVAPAAALPPDAPGLAGAGAPLTNDGFVPGAIWVTDADAAGGKGSGFFVMAICERHGAAFRGQSWLDGNGPAALEGTVRGNVVEWIRTDRPNSKRRGELAGAKLAAAFTNEAGHQRSLHLRLGQTVRILPGKAEPQVVSIWSVEFFPPGHRVFVLYSNGKMNDLHGDSTWSRQGDTLSFLSPSPKAPKGVWRDRCKLTADGKAFEGQNQIGVRLKGKKLSDGFPLPASAASVAPPAAAPAAPRKADVRTGHWTVVGDELRQHDTSRAFPALAFGDPAWADYDFSVEAMRVEGNDLFGLLFRVEGPGNAYCFGVGEEANTLAQVGSNPNGHSLKKRPAKLRNDVWYAATVKVRGERIECVVKEGAEILASFAVDDDRHPHGRVGLRTSGSAFRFRNIKVTAPDGKMLWEGLPELPAK